ncbi:hypothetical protein [Kribbella italica]|uniref:Uncharacterized protein n=1 Tax=Kribbella italica TaxID=1540520 RepID=A0A7W9JBE1_9ACTN|nr:hypothetical protein [Kribbella italica]MBB5839044.1 hypothetical protein [Kribbella italica]
MLARTCQDDVRLRDHTRRAFHEVVVELLVNFDRYRRQRPGNTLGLVEDPV